MQENARLLQSLYDEETARFEAAMYKVRGCVSGCLNGCMSERLAGNAWCCWGRGGQALRGSMGPHGSIQPPHIINRKTKQPHPTHQIQMMRRLKEEEGAAAKVAEAGRVEREQLQREYEAKLKERERALAAATEGREGLQRRLDAELEVGGVWVWVWACVKGRV